MRASRAGVPGSTFNTPNTPTTPPGAARSPASTPFGGPQVATSQRNPNVIEPEILPMGDEQLVQVGDPALSPLGRAALGAAIGGLVTAAFELPGGPVLGVLAGGTIGYFLPVGGKRG